MFLKRNVLSYLLYKVHNNGSYPSVFGNFKNVRSFGASNVRDEEASVSSTDIKRTLRLHGYSLEDGFTCISIKCPICKGIGKHSTSCAQTYINKTTGFFLCPSCNYSGKWSSLEKIIKKPEVFTELKATKSISKYDDSFTKQWKSIASESTFLSKMPSHQVEEVLKKFDLPVFPEASKVLADVCVSNDETLLYFPLQDLSNKIVGYIQCQKGLIQTHTEPKNNCRGLLWFKGTRTHSKEQSVILVSSIGDALSVVSQKLQVGVACLPYGISSLPQEILPILERWSKLILWVDLGITQIRALTRKLGESRCLLIRPTDTHPLARDALKDNLDLKSIVSSAHPIWHKSITTFKHLREDVLSDLFNIEKVQGIKWRRYPVLNKLLLGHRKGELTVLTGPTGCGKTTFCSEYSLDLILQGVTTLWGSFEIKNVRLIKTMLQQLAGFPLEDNLDKYDKYADIFENLPVYFLLFHGQQTIKDVMEAVEHATYVQDIQHIIIDNVQFMLGVSNEPSKHTERFWKQDAIVSAFRTFATRTNCHVTLVMHPRKERDTEELSTNSIFGSAKASQEADNVLIIQDKRLTAIKGKKYLQIAKNRYSGDLGMMPLEFDRDALSYAHKKYRTVCEENNEVPNAQH